MATTEDIKSMELEGNLKVFKLPDILQFLGQGRMTGSLSLTQGAKEVTLNFKEGKIVGSASTDRSVRLGEMLMYAGVLNRQKLQDFLDEQATGPSDKYLGQMLVSQNVLTEEELLPFLDLQVKEEIWDIFNWEEGNFRFEQGDPGVLGVIEIRLDIEPLLLEGTRRVDEWHSIQSSVGESSEVFRANPEFNEDDKPSLDANAWRVLSLINGRLSVDAIARISNLGKFDTYWSLSQLLNAGLVVARSEKVSSVAAAKVSESTSAVAEHKPAQASNGNGAPSSGLGPISDLLARMGLKKPEVRGSEMLENSEKDRGSVRAKRNSGDPWPSDVSLICEAINQLIDGLAKSSGGSSAQSADAWLEELWRKSEERHPRADILKLNGDKISASQYERYAALEQDVTEAIRGSHDDCLAALRGFWGALISQADKAKNTQSGEEMAARILKSFEGQGVDVASPEFSIARWKSDER